MNTADREAGAVTPLTTRVRLLLAAIVAAGLALRLIYLLIAVRTPGFTWADPDGYLHNALLLARPDGWHWSFDVAKYHAGGRIYALPALYSIFLSFVALLPGLPVTALVAQIALSTIAIVLVFALGRYLHSSAAGLWASAAYAASFPNIFNVWSTSQESLYIPLVLAAFVLYARALVRHAGPLAFGIAGAVLGLAALTRSMPLFFVGPVLVLHVAIAPDRRAALRQSAACLAGFALVVVPYCIGLSRALGQLTIVDSHTGFRVESEQAGSQAPGLSNTAEALWNLVAADPPRFAQSFGERIRTLLYVNGGRLLQIYVVAGNEATATLWKVLVHIGTDLLLIAAAILVWPGAVLCRNRRLAAVLLLWAAVNIVIVGLSGFGGARLRAPFEPMLLVIGAVVLAGGWRRPSWPLTAATLLCAAATALIVVPQLPRSFRSWPDYGVAWPSVLNRRAGIIRGTGALNVPAYNGTASVRLDPMSAPGPVQVDVRAEGVTVRSVRLERDIEAIAWPWPRRGLAFAELEVRDVETARPADVRIEVGPR